MESLTANNGGVSSVRTLRSEQAQRRKGVLEGWTTLPIETNAAEKTTNMEVQPCGDCWIGTVMRREVRGHYKRVRRELKKRKGGASALRSLDTDGLDEEVQGLVRHTGDGTVEVHSWMNDVQWIFSMDQQQCAETVNWRKKTCQPGRRRRLK